MNRYIALLSTLLTAAVYAAPKNVAALIMAVTVPPRNPRSYISFHWRLIKSTDDTGVFVAGMITRELAGWPVELGTSPINTRGNATKLMVWFIATKTLDDTTPTVPTRVVMATAFILNV